MPEINKDNINEVFRLSNGHLWTDGLGNINNITWMREADGRDKISIMLSEEGGTRSISIGDTIYVDNGVIKEEWLETAVIATQILTGEFTYTGIENNEKEKDLVMSLNYDNGIIRYVLSRDEIGEIKVYDIMGRMLKKETKNKKGIYTMSLKEYPSGIYFIKLKQNEKELTIKGRWLK